MDSSRFPNQIASGRKARLVVGSTLLACVLGVSIGITVLFIQEISVAHYPGAEEMSAHIVTNGLAQLHLRRDISYKSTDDFLDVRQWYAQKFGLGLAGRETHSNCVMIEGDRELLMFKRHMSVTVCNNEQFQRIFVKRSLYIDTR